jgi:hypothetical protein
VAASDMILPKSSGLVVEGFQALREFCSNSGRSWSGLILIEIEET